MFGSESSEFFIVLIVLMFLPLPLAYTLAEHRICRFWTAVLTVIVMYLTSLLSLSLPLRMEIRLPEKTHDSDFFMDIGELDHYKRCKWSCWKLDPFVIGRSLYALRRDGRLFKFDKQNGKLERIVRLEITGAVNECVAINNHLFWCGIDDKREYVAGQIDFESAQRVWKTKLGGCDRWAPSSIVIQNDLVVIKSGASVLSCLERRTGKILWSRRFKRSWIFNDATCITTAPLIHKGALLIGISSMYNIKGNNCACKYWRREKCHATPRKSQLVRMKLKTGEILESTLLPGFVANPRYTDCSNNDAGCSTDTTRSGDLRLTFTLWDEKVLGRFGLKGTNVEKVDLSPRHRTQKLSKNGFLRRGVSNGSRKFKLKKQDKAIDHIECTSIKGKQLYWRSEQELNNESRAYVDSQRLYILSGNTDVLCYGVVLGNKLWQKNLENCQ